ncbi:uncharacterized protein LOC106478078 [Limulus polyphemus]|uniref:Uncharacterized protein LOC106478078 n=1 Tax=Limulus polyphemus TaxID=6850 RepID=A0ABM1C4L8_LIMPO|nr:uncharacterized protein LOC106478078 [Limulus polyphemus]
MLTLSLSLALSAWLCFCSGHVQVSPVSTSRQRLQNLLNQSPYSGYSTSGKKGRLESQKDSDYGEFLERSGPEPTSSYQQFYRTYYGTPEGIENMKKTYGPTGLRKALVAHNIQEKLEEVRQANDHFLKIRKMATCKTPSPQVIRVKDYFPDSSKQYVPRCTILHRCSDQSGCCDDEQHKCGPLRVQEVTLHFYTLHLKNRDLQIGIENAVEKLLFINHTECECQPINNQPRLKEDHRFASNNSHERKLSDVQSSKCQECPVPFNKREYPDGRCSCDCFDHQKTCLRIKRGRDPLVDVEKRCVLAGYCHMPDCEYGPYDPIQGICPKRPENYARKNHKKRSHSSHYHRWAFFERD